MIISHSEEVQREKQHTGMVYGERLGERMGLCCDKERRGKGPERD